MSTSTTQPDIRWKCIADVDIRNTLFMNIVFLFF